jgi:hypothetical protein
MRVDRLPQRALQTRNGGQPFIEESIVNAFTKQVQAMHRTFTSKWKMQGSAQSWYSTSQSCTAVLPLLLGRTLLLSTLLLLSVITLLIVVSLIIL